MTWSCGTPTDQPDPGSVVRSTGNGQAKRAETCASGALNDWVGLTKWNTAFFISRHDPCLRPLPKQCEEQTHKGTDEAGPVTLPSSMQWLFSSQRNNRAHTDTKLNHRVALDRPGVSIDHCFPHGHVSRVVRTLRVDP